MTDKVFHFVRNHEVAAYERLGWLRHDGLDDTHHGAWSSLMEWKGEGEPVKPFFISHETVMRPVASPNGNTNDERTTAGA